MFKNNLRSMVQRMVLAVEAASLEDKLKILRAKYDAIIPFFKKVKTDAQKNDIWKILVESDPTPTKSYLQWILIKGIKGWDTKPVAMLREDIPKFEALFDRYDMLKRKNKLKPADKDINQIKDFVDLSQRVKEYAIIETDSERDKRKKEEQNFIDSGKATILYNSPRIKITIPHSKEASCYFGRNTQWCTAAKNHNAFTRYNKEGPLYILLYKPENKRWQLHFNKNGYISFCDEQDEEVELSKPPFSNEPFYDEFREAMSDIAEKVLTINNFHDLIDFVKKLPHKITMLYLDRERTDADTISKILNLATLTDADWQQIKQDNPSNYASYLVATGKATDKQFFDYCSKTPVRFRDNQDRLTPKQREEIVDKNGLYAFQLKEENITPKIIQALLYTKTGKPRPRVISMLTFRGGDIYRSPLLRAFTVDDWATILRTTKKLAEQRDVIFAMLRTTSPETIIAVQKKQPEHMRVLTSQVVNVINRQMDSPDKAAIRKVDMAEMFSKLSTAGLIDETKIEAGDLSDLAEMYPIVRANKDIINKLIRHWLKNPLRIEFISDHPKYLIGFNDLNTGHKVESFIAQVFQNMEECIYEKPPSDEEWQEWRQVFEWLKTLPKGIEFMNGVFEFEHDPANVYYKMVKWLEKENLATVNRTIKPATVVFS